jgi:hypothetical protein
MSLIADFKRNMSVHFNNFQFHKYVGKEAVRNVDMGIQQKVAVIEKKFMLNVISWKLL